MATKGYTAFTKGEGVNISGKGVVLFDQVTAPSTTTDKLYNVGGTLYFNATALGSGSATAYDDIGNPDANGSIAMGAYTGTYTSATASWGGLIAENSNSNPTAGATLLSLKYTADGDAHGIFLKCIDNSGADTKFQIGADGNVTIAGTAVGTDAITITAGDITMDSGDMTMTSGSFYLSSGAIDLSAGDVRISKDNQKLTLGDSDDTDSYLTFNGTSLVFYDSALGSTRTLSQLAGSGLSNPTVVGDMTISDGKFTWTNATAEASGVWAFAGTTTIDIAITSVITTGGVITVTADSMTSGSIFKAISSNAGLTTGNYFEAANGGSTVFEVGLYGAVTIAGNAATDVFTITTGDAVLSDGSVTITDADAASSLVITNNSVATADLVSIASTGCTTGAMMKINANGATHDGEVLELISAGDATSTPIGLSVTLSAVAASTGANAAHGIWVDLPESTSGANGVTVRMDKITSAVMLDLDAGGGTMSSGWYIRCGDDTVADFEVRDDGATTITTEVNSTIALSVTGIQTSANMVVIDNTAGVVASGYALLKLDAGGNSASGSNMLRLAPTGTPAAGSIGMEFVGNGKVMQAMYLDSDPTANSVAEIRGGGALTDGNAVVEIGVDGALAAGGCGLLIEQGTGSPNSDSRMLEIEATGTDMRGIYADVDGATNDVYYFESGGAIASGKAVMHVVSSGACANSYTAVIRATYSGAGPHRSRIIEAVATGSEKNVNGLYVDCQPTASDVTGHVKLYNSDTGAQGAVMVGHHDSASPAANDQVFGIFGFGEDSGSNATLYGQMTIEVVVATDGTEEGGIKLGVTDGGTIRESFYLTDDHLGLGDSAAFVLGNTGSYDLSISTNVTSAGLSANEPKIVFTDGATGDITITAGATSGDVVLGSPIVLESSVGVTAHVGSAQGNGAFTETFLEIAVCANGGDAVTLPGAEAGKFIIVTNRGANSADVFPASGDDINEAGADTAIAVAADASRIFIGIDGTHWESFILARA